MEQGFFEKLAVAQLIKKFSSSDVTGRFICILTVVPHTELDECRPHPLTLFLEDSHDVTLAYTCKCSAVAAYTLETFPCKRQPNISLAVVLNLTSQCSDYRKGMKNVARTL
jgi:hypothetical protein